MQATRIQFIKSRCIIAYGARMDNCNIQYSWNERRQELRRLRWRRQSGDLHDKKLRYRTNISLNVVFADQVNKLTAFQHMRAGFPNLSPTETQ
jgi:hypothetical protein